MATSVDWTLQNGGLANFWTGVAYGNGKYVAVARSGSSRAATSTDGITWTARAAPTSGWTSVCYGTPSSNKIFVAVADSGTSGQRAMTGADGTSWIARTTPADYAWTSVCYGGTSPLYVAVASSGTGNRVMTSTNGGSSGGAWQLRTSAADNNWQSVCYGNSLFVAVANSGTGNRVMTSPDGIAWTARASAADNSWQSVCYDGTKFVAVASGTATNTIMISTNGINWTGYDAFSGDWSSIAYGNGVFVCVPNTNATYAMTSNNGIAWELRSIPSGSTTWKSVTYGPVASLFVAVSGNVSTTNSIMTGVVVPSCFNEGVRVDCCVHIGTVATIEQRCVEDLAVGDLVMTYRHGPRRIKHLCHHTMINDPTKFWHCMYVHRDDPTLILTGGHGILVDAFHDEEEHAANDACFPEGITPRIDDKYVLLVSVNRRDFSALNNRDMYTYYQFVLDNETDGDEEADDFDVDAMDRRYGVWANGVLVETPSERQFLK